MSQGLTAHGQPSHIENRLLLLFARLLHPILMRILGQDRLSSEYATSLLSNHQSCSFQRATMTQRKQISLSAWVLAEVHIRDVWAAWSLMTKGRTTTTSIGERKGRGLEGHRLGLHDHTDGGGCRVALAVVECHILVALDRGAPREVAGEGCSDN